jgi:hypothetical protein
MVCPVSHDEWREMVDQDEHYLVAAIERHLLDDVQRAWLAAEHKTIADLLNGRWAYEKQFEVQRIFFTPWNEKLGWVEFGV